MTRLCLGTVQFGLDYGITNASGKPTEDMVESIISLAIKNDVCDFDTAPAYGDAEALLGKFIPPGADARIISKSAVFKNLERVTQSERDQMRASLEASLKAFNRLSLSALLLHHTRDVFLPNGHTLIETLLSFRSEGLVEKVGVSIYSAEEIDRVLDIFTPDIVQVPLNILDQRLIRSGHLQRLKERHIEVHARSVFLQGLLLTQVDELPSFLTPIRDTFAALNDTMRICGMLAGCLDFIRQRDEVDVLLVGATSIDELQQILEAFERAPSNQVDYTRFAIDDPRYVNPAAWPKLPPS